MCALAPVPGWNGLVIALPSGDTQWIWLLLLLPLALPPLSYIMRPVAELQNMFALPAFRMEPVSYKLPSLRWFVAQTALLLLAFSLVVFVLIPSDPIWRSWSAQTQASMLPECQAALEAIRSQHSASENAIVLFGCVLPWALFVASVMHATFARERS